jgi:hypothetical protein
MSIPVRLGNDGERYSTRNAGFWSLDDQAKWGTGGKDREIRLLALD